MGCFLVSRKLLFGSLLVLWIWSVSFQSFVIRHLVMAPKRNYGIRKVISKGLCDVIDDRIVVVEHGRLCMKA